MKKTFKEIREADNVVARMYQDNPKLRETKFGYAWGRFCDKNLAPTLKELQTKLTEINIINALEDPITKEILIDKTSLRGFKYAKDGLRKCIAEENAVLAEYETKEIKIEPYIASFTPELTEEQVEVLTGLVI